MQPNLLECRSEQDAPPPPGSSTTVLSTEGKSQCVASLQKPVEFPRANVKPLLLILRTPLVSLTTTIQCKSNVKSKNTHIYSSRFQKLSCSLRPLITLQYSSMEICAELSITKRFDENLHLYPLIALIVLTWLRLDRRERFRLALGHHLPIAA